MTQPTSRRRLAAALTVCALGAALLGGSPAWASNDVLSPGTEIFNDPHSTTKEAAHALRGQARRDALRLSKIPSSTWFTDGTPAEVERDVR
jgi:endoglucanase